jgi:hypothetical protein
MSTRQCRFAVRAGIIGPLLFVLTFSVEGWLRPEYHPLGMYISALSLGPRGWIQIANFMLFGVLLFAFSRATAVEFADGIASRAGPRLLELIAIGLFVSGPLVMDPMSTPPRSMSPHGIAHQVFGAIVFALMPVTCVVFARRFRVDPAWRWFRPWTLAAAMMIVVGIVLLKIAQRGLPPNPPSSLTLWIGLVQRWTAVTFFTWVVAFAAAIERLTQTRDREKTR